MLHDGIFKLVIFLFIQNIWVVLFSVLQFKILKFYVLSVVSCGSQSYCLLPTCTYTSAPSCSFILHHYLCKFFDM